MTLATINLLFEKCPIHVCETRAIAEAVVQSMTSRLEKKGYSTEYARLELPPEDSTQITIDFGGSIVYPPKFIHVPDLPRIAFLPQHASLLKTAVWRARDKGIRQPGSYFKIHAGRAYCLSAESFYELDRFLSEAWEQISEAQAAALER